MANVDISCVEGVFLHVEDVSYFVDLHDVASVVYYVAAVDNVELRIACDLRYVDFVDLHFLHANYEVHEGASVVYYVAAVDNVELRIACDLRYMDFVDLHFVHAHYDVHEGERSHELVLDEHV